MLWTPQLGPSAIQTNVTNTTNESATFSTSVTAGTSPNKNANYTTIIAATSYESFGISVALAGLQTTASTNQRCLVDIAIGGAGSEQVIIPNLTCGNVPDYAASTSGGAHYFFPIRIPAGVRISGNAAASTSADVVNVAVRLYQHGNTNGRWYGSRVTAYGADTANVRGTSHTATQNNYATGTQLTASTTNPIKAMQLGYDLLSDTTGGSLRALLRIGVGAGPTYVVTHLPVRESTTLETVEFTLANAILQPMCFNIPAGQALLISAATSIGSPEARGYVVYGVD